MIQKTTQDIFMSQIQNGYCRRMDIVVHYLAIENYYGINNFGFDLCLDVHQRRIGCKYEQSKKRIDNFKKLIGGLTRETFDTNKYPLRINLESMDIVQGSHRIALALYLGINNLYVKNARRRKHIRDFGIKWFEKVKFNNDILIMLKNKKELIVERLLK